MRWTGGRESGNVEDRRGFSGGGIAAGGGILGIIATVLYLLLGGGGNGNDGANPIQFPQQTTQLTPEEQAADEQRAKFVKVVLAYTEDVWNNIFSQQGGQYKEPTLVLFRDAVQSACG